MRAALKLFVLVEAFDERDIDGAAALVEQYRVDAASADRREQPRPGHPEGGAGPRLEELVQELPDDVPRVAESGVVTAADAARLAAAATTWR